MYEFLSSLIQRHELLKSLPDEWVYLVGMLIFAGIVLTFASLFAGITSYVERRIAGRMMSRIGPNRVGPHGFLQWLADGIKTFQKEDIIPAQADRALFRFAPYIVFAGFFASFVVLPFSSALIISDLNVGLIYIFAVTSFVVVGILMAGWASNNKWSLFGGMRSAAQIVSYEIPEGLAALPIIFLAGTLSTQGIIQAQGWAPWDWFIFHNPFTFIAFFIFYITLLAEGNRAPFDIPEAESELVSGYNTEYSGMRFLLFFFAEWGNLWVMGAIMTIMFLGGWQSPFHFDNALLTHLIELLIFTTKTSVIIFITIQLRWTLPRVRVDQLMNVCWKYLVPFSFVNLFGVAIWMLVFPNGFAPMSYLMTLLGVLILGIFIRRVIYNLKQAHVEIHVNPLI